LSHEVGKSEQIADEFYHLVVRTRKRHRLFPQPRVWFRNLLECMGDNIEIRVARKDGTPLAAFLTLRQGPCVVYKYGGSDETFHNLGGVPFLFWKLIQESRAGGAEIMDLGRSDWDQQGLMTFKDRLGAIRRRLKYYRYPPPQKPGTAARWDSRLMRCCLPVLPKSVLSAAGGVLYKHLG
jgi:lipid II:glycine glycyltransferase (peptidoglycan interpeptide bridge formation enzyme)